MWVGGVDSTATSSDGRASNAFSCDGSHHCRRSNTVSFTSSYYDSCANFFCSFTSSYNNDSSANLYFSFARSCNNSGANFFCSSTNNVCSTNIHLTISNNDCSTNFFCSSSNNAWSTNIFCSFTGSNNNCSTNLPRTNELHGNGCQQWEQQW